MDHKMDLLLQLLLRRILYPTNKFRPVAYSSWACAKKEKRYTHIEREYHAKTWEIDHHYLIGNRFNLVKNDCAFKLIVFEFVV